MSPRFIILIEVENVSSWNCQQTFDDYIGDKCNNLNTECVRHVKFSHKCKSEKKTDSAVIKSWIQNEIKVYFYSAYSSLV